MKEGADALANAVKVTLGPKGRNVVIEKKFGAPHVTKDGVTVAKEIELEDRFANMGAQMVKEVASKTNDQAGDGTTTATVLAQAIINVGLKNVTAGANPMDLKRGIDKAVEAVVANNAPYVGLSALMTTTVVNMEATIKELREKVPWCKIMVGGAVLTQEYADMIGADFYGKDAMQTVYYVENNINKS